MEPVRSGSSRGTRVTLVAVALFALLAIVAFASRSGFGGSSDARPSETYVNWAFSIFLVLFVLMIPVAVYAYVVQGREAVVRRAHSFKKVVIQNVLMFALFLGVAVFLVYIKRLRPNFFGPRDDSLTEASKTGGKKTGGKHAAFEPVFQWPVAYVAASLVVALAVSAVVLHRRRRARLRRRVPRERARLVDELSTEIGDAIDDLEVEADARRAVIAAYARMERALGRYGIRRRPSETPHEYLAHVLLDLRAPADAVRRLTDAFERAKFSRHEIGDATKRDAIGALVAVRQGLQEAAA
jgi:hypothetical protein